MLTSHGDALIVRATVGRMKSVPSTSRRSTRTRRSHLCGLAET
jgi:hypothetical protein